MATPPTDPQMLEAIRLARQLSRRRFLTRSTMGVGLAAVGPTLLAACGSSDDTDSSQSGATAGSGDKELVISNWDAYIDEDDAGNVDGAGTTIARFTEETGIKVTYNKDFNDNDEYFNRIYQPVLGKGQRINPDITVPTSWMAARIIALGWTEELLLDEIPNHANLEDAYLDIEWNPGATNFMPWQAGIAGIAWNPALTGGDLTSINDLFDPKLKGKVAMLSEWRDTVGLTMFGMGASPAEADVDDINAALDKIEEATNSGQILKFTGNEYLRLLESDDIAACVGWSGDIGQLPPAKGIKFAVPEEGGTQWFDAMTVPKGARNTVAAARWMNFVYDPENAATITEWVQFISPVKGVREVLEARGGESAALTEDPLVFPDDETLARLEVFGELEQDDEIAIQARFNDITG
jgi:spermidine/putrescine transport system substrate-binding protein